MSRHWWNPFDGMEELTFRPVEGGFLYRAPSPWLFGRYRHYFVNTEQKATLASAHRTTMCGASVSSTSPAASRYELNA